MWNSLASLLGQDVEMHISGHKEWIFDVKVHPDGKSLFTAGADGMVRQFSLEKSMYVRDFKRHTATVWWLLLHDGLLFSASQDNLLCIWKISDGTLLQELKFPTGVWCVDKLSDTRILVGLYSGELEAFDLNKAKHASSVHRFAAHHAGIAMFFVWKNRFATCSLDTSAKVWDAYSFECLATLRGHSDYVRCVSMCDSFIVTGSYDKTVRVYNSQTFELIRIIPAHEKFIRGVYFVGPEQCFLTCSDDGKSHLFRPATGELLWTKDFGLKNYPICMKVLKDGRLATGTRSGKLVLFKPPPQIKTHMKELIAYPTPISELIQPLTSALATCVAGHLAPKDHIHLLRYEGCRVSFEEWCSAHRILLMAVEDGDIERSTQYSDEEGYWFEHVYIAIKDLAIDGDDEKYQIVKTMVYEAKRNDLIECPDSVLTARHVMVDVRKTRMVLRTAAVAIVGRIQQMENRLDGVRMAFSRYERSQNKRHLVGIALHLIPIAGGAIAGAVSAGKEIFKGLSVKDVVDYAFGLGCHATEERYDSGADHVLKEAADFLKSENLASMDHKFRQELEETLEYIGKDCSEMYSLFLNGANSPDCDAVIDEPCLAAYEESPLSEHVTRHQLSDKKSEKGAVAPSEEAEDNRGVKSPSSEKPSTSVFGNLQFENISEAEETMEISQSHRSVTAIEDSQKCEDEFKTPSTGKCVSHTHQHHIPLNANRVRLMPRKEIASLWSAYAYQFEDRGSGRCDMLGKSLLRFLELHEISGLEFVDKELISVDEMMDTVLSGLTPCEAPVKLGVRARMKKFVIEARSEESSDAL